jgi:3-oxoacyl-[acyl-carrier-protein] synthase II
LNLGVAAGGGRVFNHQLFGRDAQKLAAQIDASMVSPAAVAAALADSIGARGPARTISLACASSSAAIIEAVRAIRLGIIDTALCGGVGADVDPLMLVGFGLLGILSSQGVSRPFDTRRDGFIIGEGAAMLVLSRDRGDATAAITGVGRSLDAHHLTAPAPDGAGAYRAMNAAMNEAGPQAPGYIQAHGTSTPLNDPIEIIAIQRALGPGATQIPLASVKGALGHWVAGAGALGVLCGLEALTHGVLLPTAGLQQPDLKCAMNHVTQEALHRDITKAMVNAFAFGGANCSIVMERC